MNSDILTGFQSREDVTVTAPSTLDVPTVISKKYETKTGLLNDTWVQKRYDESIPNYRTHFKVDGKRFTLYGNYSNLKKIDGLAIKVYYLPFSHKVVRIDIPLTEDNISKASELDNSEETEIR